MKGIVSFYGKTGCRGNARQMEQLRSAGYVIQEISLLDKEWDTESLPKFFNGEPIHRFVNTRAPQVASGDFDPHALSQPELLMAMINEPILIKRPLLFFRGEFACGFDSELVTRLLGNQQTDTKCEQGPECSGHA